MHKFVRSLLTEWRKLKLPFESETFIVAVSGGADSVSLLLALHELREAKKLKLNFVVAHFNHDLRGDESRKDAEFVENLAKKLEVEYVGEIQNPKFKIQNQTGNLEQSARASRYQFLSKVAENSNAYAVLTAHTLNDQAETFLLNLLRGSGAQGLGAMQIVRKLNESSKTLLVRPLLSWAKRADTESFARDKSTEFCGDAMNEDLKFSRVKIRKNLIPLLAAEYNPKIVETLAQTALLLQKKTEVINYQISSNPTLKELRSLSKDMVYEYLRSWLKIARGDLRRLDFKHIQAIEKLISSQKSGRVVELPNGEFVLKKQGKLFFEKTKVEN